MKRLLLVFSHPIDESFSCGGTIAKYVKAGWHVDLMCATRGEEGSHGPFIDVSSDGLGEIRQKELQKAGVMLGISTVTFLGYKDGTLSDQAPGDLEDTIYRKMAELVPDAVICMDTTGINNHPDHIRMSFVTTYSFQKYAAWIEEQLKDQEKAAKNFPKLYYVCMPESIVDYLKKKKFLPSESFGKPFRGVQDKYITTVINIKKFASVKKKALLSHISQQENVSKYLSLPSQPTLKHEYFILRMQGVTEVFMGKNDHVSNNL